MASILIPNQTTTTLWRLAHSFFHSLLSNNVMQLSKKFIERKKMDWCCCLYNHIASVPSSWFHSRGNPLRLFLLFLSFETSSTISTSRSPPRVLKSVPLLLLLLLWRSDPLRILWSAENSIRFASLFFFFCCLFPCNWILFHLAFCPS